MAEKRILGVQKIEVGELAADGGVATTFAALGLTYKDTATFEQEEAEDIEHECEENDDPIEVLAGSKKSTISWGIVDFDPDTLVKVLGGTKTGESPNFKWEAPASASIIEKSVKITPKKGTPITLPRVSIKARIQYTIGKAGIAQVLITGKVLTPTKAGTASIIVG
ncbi:MAG: hypothetical protein WBK12_08745 [Tenuifilaceae bacterium]